MDSSLIRKFIMKNPRTLEQMFSITNRYALAEEATLHTREQKKEPGHPDQPSSSKGHNKKRKLNYSVNAVERPHHHKEYRPKLGEFEGFLDRNCIFHPQGKHKTQDYNRLQGFVDEVLKTASRLIKRRSSRIPRVTSPRPTRRSTIFLVAPTRMSPRERKNSQPGRSWWSVPPPPSTLDDLRSPLPLTTVTTRTLYQIRGNIPGSLPHHKGRQAQQSVGGWRKLPQPPFSEDF
jgi:hypothetical protein